MDQVTLSLCVEILDTFDDSKCGVEEHLANYIEGPASHVKGNVNWLFIDEIITGCVRYKGLIKALLELFYANEGKTYLRADYSLLSVLSLLAMFRLKDIGVSSFKKVASSQGTLKMYRFLTFLFSTDNLNGKIKEELSKVYDGSFVASNIITPMLRYVDEVHEFTSHLEDILANRASIKTCSKPPTEVKPFKLTKPVPRVISYDVEEVPSLKPRRPVPKSTYRKPVEERTLASAFEANRQKAKNTLLEADHAQFACANPEKSEKTKKKLEKIRTEEEAKNKITTVKPVPVPASLKEPCSVKQTATVIYRESARIKREEKILQEKLAKLEAGDGDASEYLEWQREQREKEAAESVAEIERKHLAGQISHEEAILAKQQCIQDKKDLVQRLRNESQELMGQYFAQKQHEKQEMRRLVEATSAGQQNVREARARLTEMKLKIVQQVAQENQELMAKALEQEEIEMRKKSELIRQIHAMETVPIIRANFLDLTETSGLGLLSEMSIVELRERLSLMKIAQEEETKEKRETIKTTKEAKEQHLSETVETISQYKEEKRKQSAAKREDSKKIFKAHHAQLKAQKIDVLQEQLENKRRERLRQQKLSTQAFPATSTKNRRPSIKPIQSFSSLPHKSLSNSRPVLPTINGGTGTHLAVSPQLNPMATLIRATNRS